MFGRTRSGRELWLPILEKAYAKLYGGYGAISGGNCSEALRDLTGCAVLDVNLAREVVSAGPDDDASGPDSTLWCRMQKWLVHGHARSALVGCAYTCAMGGAAGAGSAHASTGTTTGATTGATVGGDVHQAGVPGPAGVVPNHAYSVVGIARAAGDGARLLRVRNRPNGAGLRAQGLLRLAPLVRLRRQF